MQARGAVNRLRADCFGAPPHEPARFRFHVNGRGVAAVDLESDIRRFDGVSVYVYSDRGNSVVLFDAVTVRELVRR